MTKSKKCLQLVKGFDKNPDSPSFGIELDSNGVIVILGKTMNDDITPDQLAEKIFWCVMFGCVAITAAVILFVL